MRKGLTVELRGAEGVPLNDLLGAQAYRVGTGISASFTPLRQNS
jgi:hypothetical protein